MFRNISFVGNTKYPNEKLHKILSIESDVFDNSLDSRIMVVKCADISPYTR